MLSKSTHRYCTLLSTPSRLFPSTSNLKNLQNLPDFATFKPNLLLKPEKRPRQIRNLCTLKINHFGTLISIKMHQ